MAKIKNLKGIESDEAERLVAAGVDTIEELWIRISEDRDNGIKQICQETNIAENRLLELLAAEGLCESGRGGFGWLKQHWADLAVATGFLLLIILIWRIL